MSVTMMTIHHDDYQSLSSHDSLSDDKLQEVQNDHATYTSCFASKDDIQDDHCLHDQSRYKKMYDWLYYSPVAHGYTCEICEVFYGKSPVPTGRGKQISTKCVSKLINIVHFLGKHNLPIKELYPALLDFIAFDLEEPITKQYLENCLKNATYNSHATSDSLISALNKFIKKEMNTKLRNASDVVIFADEAKGVARKKMMGIFLSCYIEDDHEFVMEYPTLLEVPLTKSLFFLMSW